MFGWKLVKEEKPVVVTENEINKEENEMAKETKKSGKGKLIGGLVAAGAVLGAVGAVLLKKGSDPGAEFEDAEIVSDDSDSGAGEVSETDFTEE